MYRFKYRYRYRYGYRYMHRYKYEQEAIKKSILRSKTKNDTRKQRDICHGARLPFAIGFSMVKVFALMCSPPSTSQRCTWPPTESEDLMRLHQQESHQLGCARGFGNISKSSQTHVCQQSHDYSAVLMRQTTGRDDASQSCHRPTA